MSKSKYTVRELFGSRDIKQIVIPEIQRDYVWGEDNVKKLLKSVIYDAQEQTSNMNKEKNLVPELDKLSLELRERLERLNDTNKIYSNIGFIYAYEDKNFRNRYFLIDGQQRLTTIFLLLLAVAIKSGKIDEFRNRYFVEEESKLDYKVRESTHSFIIKFVKYLLSGKKVEEIEQQYWYFPEYSRDVTIKSILSNYRCIIEYIEDKEISLEYVEDYIEVWFFNINKSQQGEELYIYMNSRGESVQSNENIKANLLEVLSSEEEKNSWGGKWEVWQDYFWKKKAKNLNADKGFNEFLKCLKIINRVTDVKLTNLINLKNEIKSLKDAKVFNSDYLDITDIEEYLDAFKVLFSDESSFKQEWLQGDLLLIDYVKLLPVLMFLKKNPDCSNIDLKRVYRFFENVTRFEDISKNPDTYTVYCILLMTDFLNAGYTDVADMIAFAEKKQYANILTKEEVFKFKLYLNISANLRRADVELEFWKSEDFIYNEGKISFVLDCIDRDLSDEDIINFDLTIFRKFSDNLAELFTKPTDLVRRSLLVHGDYSVWDGYSTSIGSGRYSLGCETKTWKKIFNEDDNRVIIKDLLKDVYSRKSVEVSSTNDILSDIINDYLKNENEKLPWMIEFVKNKEILSYSELKKFCWQGDSIEEIFIMKRQRATDYRELTDF